MTNDRTLASVQDTVAHGPDEVPDGASHNQGSRRRPGWRKVLLTFAACFFAATLLYGLHVRVYDRAHSAAADWGLPDYAKTENDKVFLALQEVERQWLEAGALLQPTVEGADIQSVSSLLAPKVLELVGKDMDVVLKGDEVNPAETARLALQPLIDKRIKQAQAKDRDTSSIAWKAAKDATRAKATDPTISSLNPAPTACPTPNVAALLGCANEAQLASLGQTKPPPTLLFGKLSLSPGIDHTVMFGAWMIVAVIFALLILTGAMGALFNWVASAWRRG